MYDEAIDLNPRELTFYTNKAAVFFEMKQFQEVIELCE